MPRDRVRVGSATEDVSNFKLPPRSGLTFLFVALSVFAVLCIRNHSVFSVPIHEQGDEAANSILVNQAVHFHLLVGNYSREGFNHPGPAFLYILSFGQDLFYSWLHAVPAPFNGQLIAVFLLSSALLALTALVIARHMRTRSGAVLAVSIIVLLTGSTLSWTSAWMPYLYAAPFLLAMLSGVSVALGAFEDLPIFTFAAALLIHGHVAFIGIMGIYVALVVIFWLLLNRTGTSYRAQLRAAKRFLIASGSIVLLFALPIALELALHWPGQFGLYWHYLNSNSQEHRHTLGQVISYVKGFWPGGNAGLTLLVLAAVASGILATTDPNRLRRRFVLGVLVGVVIMTLQLGLYAYKGVDLLNLAYTGYFYYSVPTVIVATLVVETLCRLGELLATPQARHRQRRVMAAPVVLSAGFGIAVFATQTSTFNGYWGEPALPHIAAVIHDSRLRDGRGVAFSLGGAVGDWPDTVGVLVEASREGYQPCIANSFWKFVVTSQYICSPAQAKGRWRIVVEEASVPIPPGAAVVLRNASVEVYVAPHSGTVQ
jgi:MFS family permease